MLTVENSFLSREISESSFLDRINLMGFFFVYLYGKRLKQGDWFTALM